MAEGRADATARPGRAGGGTGARDRFGGAGVRRRRAPPCSTGVSGSRAARGRGTRARMPRRAGTVAGGRWARWVTAASSARPLPRRNDPWVRGTMVRSAAAPPAAALRRRSAADAGSAAPHAGGPRGCAAGGDPVRTAPRARRQWARRPARSRGARCPPSTPPSFDRSSPRSPPSRTGARSSSSTGPAARRCPSGSSTPWPPTTATRTRTRTAPSPRASGPTRSSRRRTPPSPTCWAPPRRPRSSSART